MQEIEVKILEVNRTKIENILLDIGAKKIFDDEIEAFFFDFKNKSVSKSKSVMRLRKEGKQAILTYKTIIGVKGAKVAEEQSVEVSDIDEMKKILISLGLSIKKFTQKHRTSYQIENVHFDFDCYKGENDFIPEFMEIEADSLETIYKYASILGFKNEDCLPWSTTDLIKHYAPARYKLLDKHRFR
mgnify:CR=1 FL=1